TTRVGGGNWTMEDVVPGNGSYSYSATASDQVGNTSVASGALVVVVDTSAPAAPTVPDLAAASDSGISSIENITSMTSLTVGGMAEQGSVVQLTRSTTGVAAGTADPATRARADADRCRNHEGVNSPRARGSAGADSVGFSWGTLRAAADTAAPAVTVTGAPSGTNYILPNLPPRPTFTASDVGSGIADQYDNWTTPTTGNGSGTYNYTATATDKAGNKTTVERTYTTIAPPTSAGGGGGGGGGGSSSFNLAITPQSQTVASGSAASWTISITNTGGAYLYAVGLRDAVAPSCGIPSSFADTASFMAPGVTISYNCSLSGVTS